MSYADFPFSTTPYAAEPIENAVIHVVGVQLTIAENNLTIVAGGSVTTGSEENIIETFVGTVIAESESIVLATGVSATISLPNITDGLTLSNTYQSLTDLGAITGRAQNIVFQTDSNGILLKSSYTDAEIWWEVGGENVGAYLGIAKINDAYFIRFRTGSGQTNQQTTGGGTAGGNNSRAVVNLSVSDSSVASYFDDERHIITWAIEIPDATHLAGRLRLWIDGNEVITYDPYNDGGNVLRSGQWGGSASAGYGQGYGEIAGGDGTFDSGATQYQTFTGTSVGSDVFLNAYENQTISQLPIVVNGNALVTPTGVSSGVVLGTATATAGAIAEPTSLLISSTTGVETVTGTALIIPTGATASVDLGTAVAAADSIISVTGLAMQFADGTPTVTANAVAEPTGLQIVFSEGTATAPAAVILTGIEMSSFVGNMKSTPWANVVTGASNPWANVVTGASNTWTEVAA
jgi:hypothetical protein